MDEWIRHEGGIPPLASGELFDCRHRDGSVSRGRTFCSRDLWDHLGTPCDIVAYRIVPGPRQPLPDEG
jgi:hypothetical protein